MKTIHKQYLKLEQTQIIKVPENYKILYVANQLDQLCIWYICDTEAELEEINIRIFGTGHEIPEDYTGSFLGTVLMSGGSLVWHVFKGG